jgi:hypothetical protein
MPRRLPPKPWPLSTAPSSALWLASGKVAALFFLKLLITARKMLRRIVECEISAEEAVKVY